MDYQGINSLFDFLLLGMGFYALYASVILKKDGKIIRMFLTMRETNLEACKDLPGFSSYMAPKLSLLAGTMIACSLLSLANAYLVDIHTLSAVLMFLLFALLVWYALALKKAMRKYF